MDYEQFIAEIQKYWDLRKKGLKKQANSFLFSFVISFKENVPDADAVGVPDFWKYLQPPRSKAGT